MQIEGFMVSLNCWFDKSFHYHPSSLKSFKIIPYVKNLDISDYPKWFKDSLCWNFSKFVGQEMPESLLESQFPIWKLFSGKDMQKIRSMFTRNDRTVKKVTILWDLLQCKSLCYQVPESFKIKALEKHRSTMGKAPPMVREDLLQEIREFIVPWVEETFLSYDNITKVPNRHSNYEMTRREGGNFGYFKKNNRITSNPYLQFDKQERFDPIVIHLEGPPGYGKSALIKKICHKIQEQFGINIPNYESYGPEVYARSAATDHWDGYTNQMITIVDDFAFDCNKASKVTIEKSSLAEFIQLTSDVDYIVPMADLRDKGRKFTSKFLILSSNNGIDSCMNVLASCPKALARRLNPTYRIMEKFSDNFLKLEFNDYGFDCPEITLKRDHDLSYEFRTNRKIHRVNDIVLSALNSYIERRERFQGYSNWIQPISCLSNGISLGLKCKAFPPRDIPKVRACVVMDPLKARIITSPEAETYCLKPLQLAMFNALKRWDCFEPCFNPDYTLDKLKCPLKEDEYLLSGDYSAATDNLNYYVSQICMQSLAERFEDSYPMVSRWIRYEGQKHLIEYPKFANLPEVFQENGQLMGSLLSFPILTILNSFTICKATGCSLDSVPALLHGDDIAAKVTLNQFNQWSSIANEIGLSLSKGKNYISKEFISIDSQLFTNDIGIRKEITGKFKLVSRTEKDEFTCDRAMKNGFTKEQIRRYCSEQLSKTCRSLDIPIDYGGLGESESFPDRPLTLHEKVVYLASYELKGEVKQVCENVAMVEKSIVNLLKLPRFQNSDIFSDDEKEISFEKDLRKKCTEIHKRIRKSVKFASFVKEMRLPEYRPITLMKRIPVRCDKEYARTTVQRIQDAKLNLYPRNSDLSRYQIQQENLISNGFIRPKSHVQRCIEKVNSSGNLGRVVFSKSKNNSLLRNLKNATTTLMKITDSLNLV